MVKEGDLLWTPSPAFAEASNVTHFLRWLRDRRGLDFADYDALWRWSVTEIEAFWAALWTYFEVQSGTPYQRVLSSRDMAPGVRWFEGSTVNYAEHMLRFSGNGEDPAFFHLSETRPLGRTSRRSLGAQVRIVATRLRSLGVKPGDRVVSYMPNVPETAIAMLATVAIGAVWSSAAPEFGVKTVIERFSQIEPKVFFAADGYRFAGKDFPRFDEVQAIAAALPSLDHVIWLPYLNEGAELPPVADAILWRELMDHSEVPPHLFVYERVAHDHPLWIVFSSGTTGLPKAIAHSHVGALMEHLKLCHFHLNLKPGSVMFFYTTTGWVMWNIVLAGLLVGAAVVLYDGSPVHPEPDVLWRMAAETGTTCFGASPTYVQILERKGLEPGKTHDLSRLEAILLGGSPATPESFAWFYRAVKSDLWLTSQSGGTEIASGFVGASPTLPVHAGEIQTRMLGMDVHAWDDAGGDVTDAVGELVVTSPFPSMPVYFWNDRNGRRYHSSYFDVFPGAWRHGDFIKINRRGGCYIYGRSDSTLNRYGVRIGTAEIYRAVEQVDGVLDSLIVCCELPGGNFYMPLFVKLRPGTQLDDALRQRINARLRQDCSPRHVPDEIHQVADVPYTLTAKKMEIPVRKILMGWAPDKAASRDAMANPPALDAFIALAEDRRRIAVA
ncbi:acetoacetate--CoA ligase [Zavarzinia compransoris]|uniref:Acetoacetate--CoA ligase n=1 Tax=Zavarzinia compransoris TaxID=1264899 RepID=A0A317DSY3_9PROT|nr:acetoacetate--CoA ligase [Zavarzinia compransoris]PWR17779.1 acetoacetate--CoA ligase [Zavarzinia compransoris]TDP49308.1 acetoacetyl-CoA synthetase [Zavarzinia compransoris]